MIVYSCVNQTSIPTWSIICWQDTVFDRTINHCRVDSSSIKLNTLDLGLTGMNYKLFSLRLLIFCVMNNVVFDLKLKHFFVKDSFPWNDFLYKYHANLAIVSYQQAFHFITHWMIASSWLWAKRIVCQPNWILTGIFLN